MAFDQAVQYAWLDELKVITDNRRSKYHWTSSEINEIRRKGVVSGYTPQLIKPADKYPELADDPSNIKFIKADS